MRTGRLLLIILIVIIFTCLIFSILSRPLIGFLASGLVVNEEIQKSDAVAVLGGNSPSRVLEAIDLYNNGLASSILITLGGMPEGMELLRSRNIFFPEEADLNKFVAEKSGIKKKDIILIPGRVYSTKEEAETIKNFASENGYSSIIIATSKSHSKRAKLIFENTFKNSGIKIKIRASKYDNFDPGNLNINKNYWKVVVMEYQKIFYYYAGEIL